MKIITAIFFNAAKRKCAPVGGEPLIQPSARPIAQPVARGRRGKQETCCPPAGQAGNFWQSLTLLMATRIGLQDNMFFLLRIIVCKTRQVGRLGNM